MDVGPSALSFTYDRVFASDSTQEDVYDFAAKPVVESVLEGFNGTVFAYGQTSSGKTYTMMGPDIEDSEFSGIIPRMVTTVFDYISDTPDHIEFTVKVSIIEIYMERIRDLLNPKKTNLKIREDKSKGIYIEDVTESYVSEEKDVYDFLRYGNANRATTTTNMNETSSRSHCIFMMTIHQNNLLEMSAKTGKLYLVDLAGSEKVAKTGAVGQVLEEAKEINKSLSALGNVINALTDNKSHQHIPYRDSKLTRMLQESLGGNSRTSLIINCSPSSFNENETISALRFGYRAKSIKNTPKINREFTAAQLQMLLEKAEKKLVQKDTKIRALETVIGDHGIDLPVDYENQMYELQSPFEKRSNPSPSKIVGEVEVTMDGYSDDESSSKLDLLSPSKNIKGNQQERIKTLENELRIERLSLSKQTEKVKVLKIDLSEINNKMVMVEKENEALINKLATLTLKMQELEEKFRDKEMKLEILQLLKDILMTENEELKKSRKYFLNDLAEENNEILKLAQNEGLITPKKNQGDSSYLQESNQNKDTYFTLLEELIKEMIKEISQRLSIKNVQALKELTIPYVDKLKEVYLLQSELNSKRSKNSSEGTDEIRRKYEKLREELALEKQKNIQVKSEYERVIKEYDVLMKNNIPSFEEWKQGIGGESFRMEESIDIKDDTIIFKDLPNKRESNLVINLDNANKDKKKGSRLTDNFIETSQTLEQQINTLQSVTANETSERKSPMKTQRMINLEKQLTETKELVNQYKNKIESLKSLITTNPSSEGPSSRTDYSEKMENSETFKQHKQIIRQEVLNQVQTNEEADMQSELLLNAASGMKIVKPIKGGQSKEKKSPGASQKFFDVLKQQYRFNRSFINNLDEGILAKQKQQGPAVKVQSIGKPKGS